MPRNPSLAKIHIAKKELGLDDETYRAMLQQHGGVTSSKDLTPLGAARVLQHLEKSGFKPKVKASYGKRPNPPARRAALIRKIEAQLTHAGRPWSYADAMAQRMFKIVKVDWLDEEQLGKIVAALAIDAKRHPAQGQRETDG
ncbi:GemA protein [Massilia sp. KIM]|uniref:gp16 family protein n=1 Tax=Massilia sp. KIM TaxID=1955422 RepID=UPI00098FE424|nr:regulatory protein GemA [Massilia sp. KIM]OON62304.1 GemA protein [Massilia sp. KIM]